MFKYFFKREIQEKYNNNLMGLSWVLIQPLILLAVYSFIFEQIFKAKVPEASMVGFTTYLAIALWPWLAFSESVLKSITAIDEKKDLVGKVSLDFKIPVMASISATFFLNMLGYVVVLLVLILIGKDFNYSRLILLIIPIAQLYVLALSLGLILAAVQVYIKDTLNIISTLMIIWFYLTPIIYSKSIIPEKYHHFLNFNPIYVPIDFIHNSLLSTNNLQWGKMLLVSVLFLLLLKVAMSFFKKLSSKFVDFI